MKEEVTFASFCCCLGFLSVRVMMLQEISPLFARRPLAFIAVALLPMLLFCGGYSQSAPQQLIVGLVGDDVLLPCFLKNSTDASNMQVEWTRTDLAPGFVYVWEKNKENVDDKQPSYVGRTSLSFDRVKHGDISLTLSKVELSDAGPYRCVIPQLGQESVVQLIVGSVSMPVIRVIYNHSGIGVLECKSAGWYPEPELVWLDGEGNPLSAGPKEIFRSPSGLYTVNSRVTVKKVNSNKFTCRVQQKNINQSTEADIQGDFSMDSPSSTFIIVIVGLLYFCALVSLVWNCILPKICAHKKNVTKPQEENQTPDSTDSTQSRTRERRETSVVEQLENDTTPAATSEEMKENTKKKETEMQNAFCSDSAPNLNKRQK